MREWYNQSRFNSSLRRFDILRKLGQGTYGKVQLAVNKDTGQEVRYHNKTYKDYILKTYAPLPSIQCFLLPLQIYFFLNLVFDRCGYLDGQ